MNPQYFPVGLFSKYPELSDWEARWYASELRALNEPSVLEDKVRHSVVSHQLLIDRQSRSWYQNVSLAGGTLVRPSHRRLTGYECHSESGLRTWKRYCPEGADERSTTTWIEVTPSFNEATPLVPKITPPAVVVIRIS